MGVKEEIDELRKKLVKYQQVFKDIEEGIKDLKSQNRSEISQKEQELENWRRKLEVCQDEKKSIEQAIKDKVKELENSNLSNTEKQAKINKLLTEHREELDKVDSLISEERVSYRSIRNVLINKLCEPCPECVKKDQVNHRLFVTNWVIIITGSLLAFSFAYAFYSFAKKKKKNND